MANSKIRIKVGQIEIDYDGDHDFLKADLLSLLKEAVALAGSTPIASAAQSPPTTPPSKLNVGTVNAISAKLAVSSGNEMMTAAAAKIHFVDNKETFSRQRDFGCDEVGTELLQGLLQQQPHQRPEAASG